MQIFFNKAFVFVTGYNLQPANILKTPTRLSLVTRHSFHPP
jgi:hypothetical protein